MTHRRRIGRSDLEVAPFCLGGNVFGWTADEPTSFALLDAFLEAGFNFIDTADVYARWAPGLQGGESETVLGNWFAARKNRERVVLMTKVGGPTPNGKGLSASYIRTALEASLKRLRTDYVDLYLSHHDDPDTPMEETLEAYAELISQGKARFIGCSNFSPERLKEALTHSPRYECLQPQYNLMERKGYEDELEGICLREQVGVTGYYSLASGFLTGKYRSQADLAKSVRGALVKGYLDERGHRVLGALDDVAARHQATLAQVSLAWLMARPSVTAPIASATSLAQLQELLKAAALELSAADVEQLDLASS